MYPLTSSFLPFRTRTYGATLVGLVFSQSERISSFRLITVFMCISFNFEVKSKVENARPSDCIKNKRATEKGGHSSIKKQ